MNDIGTSIINGSETIKKKYEDYAKFTLDKQLIIIAIGVCIGLATQNVITNIMNEIFLPLIINQGKKTLYFIIYKLLLINSKHIGFINTIIEYTGKFIWHVLIWMIIILFSYIFLTKLIKIDIVTTHINLIEDSAKLFLEKS